VNHRPTNSTPAPFQHLQPKSDPGVLTPEDLAALLLDETLISLAQAARLFPPTRQDKAVHVSTILRWILRGVRGVRLEAARAGGRWITSREAVARFVAALTASHSSQPGTDARPIGAAEQLRHERVEERLRRIGLA
jgi:hypothetical protein